MNKKTIILTTMLLGGIILSFAQGENPGWRESATRALPPDPAVVRGKLANGLSYYIMRNTEPKDRAVMYLAVKAGSMQEEENQRGLAHFVEHMAFNGTTNFPGKSMLDYLQKQGVKFGADINAYTGFEETVYELPIPTDKPEVVQQGLQVLRDWAGELLFEQAELDAERGVILAEKKQRSGAQQRIQDKTLPVLLNGSRYVHRLPIGTEEVLNGFKRADIVDFYTDWYRPDLQGVIIVGDIDVAAMEAEVKRLFTGLKPVAGPKAVGDHAVALAGDNQFQTVIDPEVGQATVQVLYKHPARKLRTEADLQQLLVQGLGSMMLGTRFSETGGKPNPPFSQASAGYGGLLGGLDAFTITVVPHKGKTEAGFSAAMAELEGVRRHGFTGFELERQRAVFQAFLDAQLNEKDKRPSKGLADALKKEFLEGTAMMDIEAENALTKRLLPEITLQEVNDWVQSRLHERNRDIIVVAPEKEKVGLPNPTQLENWLAAVRKLDIQPLADEAFGGSLLAETPKPGSVTGERSIEAIEATEWTLSNGAKVIFKATDFKNDEILFYAGSEGGTSLYPDADYESASNASGLVPSFGLGDYDNIALPKVLTGKRVKLTPFIGERNEGISGSTPPGDLQTAMELTHLYFTAPRSDTALFSTTMQRTRQAFANRYADPKAILGDTLSRLLGNYHPRYEPYTVARLGKIELDRSVEIYRERFADAGDFTFYFIGNVNPDTLRPLVETYIASLPAKGVKEQAKDLGIRLPKGQVSRTIHGGKEDKATVAIYLHGSRDTTREEALALTALGDIVQYRLLERLREQEGGIYSPSVRMGLSREPVPVYQLAIRFECSPGDVEKLVAATHEEIAKLRTDGIPADDLEKFKAEYLRQQEVDARTNQFWLNYLYAVEEGTKPVDDLEQVPGRVERLSAEGLKDAAGRYLKGEDVIKVVMLPVEHN